MKKWTNNELQDSIEYINNGFSYDEIAYVLKRTKKSVRLKLNKLGFFIIPKITTIEKECNHCEQKFISSINEDRKYCSSSCAAKENNKLYIKRLKTKTNEIDSSKESNTCLNCNCTINNSVKQYCNLNCFQDFLLIYLIIIITQNLHHHLHSLIS